MCCRNIGWLYLERDPPGMMQRRCSCPAIKFDATSPNWANGLHVHITGPENIFVLHRPVGNVVSFTGESGVHGDRLADCAAGGTGVRIGLRSVLFTSVSMERISDAVDAVFAVSETHRLWSSAQREAEYR